MEGRKQQSSFKKFPRSCGLPFHLHPDGQSSATWHPAGNQELLSLVHALRPPVLVSELRGCSLPSFASI